MEEISEKLKLKSELHAFYGIYGNSSIEQYIPYTKENFKELSAKEKKLCTEYVEEFVKNNQNVKFKDFIKNWVKKADLLWDNTDKLYYEGISGMILKYDVHHYICKLLIHELEKCLSGEKKEQLKELKDFYKKHSDSGYDSIFKYKEISNTQMKLYQNLSVGFSKENLQNHFEDYITYLCATFLLIHEHITEELIIAIIESKAKKSFDIKMVKKEIKAMAKRVYTTIINLDDIKTFIVTKFLELKKLMRYQLGGILLLFNFTDDIFDADRDFVKRGRELTEILFNNYLLDEFIKSDSKLQEHLERRIVLSMEERNTT